MAADDIKHDNRATRAMTTRPKFERATSWAPAELLPMFNKVPGWAYRWVRTSMLGQADAKNVSSQLREGWEPVQLSDHPEIQLFTNDANDKGRIEVGGLMLCKIPEAFVEQRNAYYNKKTQEQTNAIDNNFMKESDRRMPLFSERKSTTTFGSGSR